MTGKAFFRTAGDWYVGNDAARGPWSADACHAGPVTGVIARAVEHVVPNKQLTRLTVTFRRPLPMAGFRVDALVERNGRTVSTVSATLYDSDNRLCAEATSLHLATQAISALPTQAITQPLFDEAKSGAFPVEKAMHGLPFFSDGIEVKYPPGQTGDPGPTTLWMRTIAIVENEVPTAFQSLCPLADCGNGISRNAEFSSASFLNADLSIVVHRLPESDWLASSAISFWENNGIGMSHATLFDKRGALGTALQSLVVKPVGG